MIQTQEEIKSRIEKLVQTRDNIIIKSSRFNERIEKYILRVIGEILKKTNQDRFVDMVYTIAKELIINAVKANQKRIFFEEMGLNINNENDYVLGMENYKKRFSELMVEEFGKKCQQKGIKVIISFSYSMKGLCLEVMNNTPVIKAEENRLREKMKKAMQYNDIAEFYMDNMDNSEGAGLGIALIMILMKNENLDPSLFRVINRKEDTVARVEIPFTDDYISMRSLEVDSLKKDDSD